MPYSTYAKNKLLDTLRNVSFAVTTTYLSLHSASPGDTGANEISGGSPAYARKSTVWNAATGGSMDNSDTPVIDVPASTTVTHLGVWDAVTAGNFLGYVDITDETFTAQGTYTVSDLDLDLNAA